MEIRYKNNKIQAVCTSNKTCDIKYGHATTRILSQRIQQIQQSSCVEEMILYCIGRCHPLHGDRKGQYAIDLIQPYRLIIEKYHNQINIVQIDEIIDYH